MKYIIHKVWHILLPNDSSFLAAQIVEVSDIPLRVVIENLGGWPVTEPNWTPEKSISLEKLMGLLKRNFTLGVLIEEWIGPDDRDSNRHIIQARIKILKYNF